MADGQRPADDVPANGAAPPPRPRFVRMLFRPDTPPEVILAAIREVRRKNLEERAAMGLPPFDDSDPP